MICQQRNSELQIINGQSSIINPKGVWSWPMKGKPSPWAIVRNKANSQGRDCRVAVLLATTGGRRSPCRPGGKGSLCKTKPICEPCLAGVGDLSCETKPILGQGTLAMALPRANGQAVGKPAFAAATWTCGVTLQNKPNFDSLSTGSRGLIVPNKANLQGEGSRQQAVGRRR